MRWKRIISILIALPFLICCTSENGRGQQKSEKKSVINDVNRTPTKPEKLGLDDEQEFRKLLEVLKADLKKKNLNSVGSLLHFPFYTSQKTVSGGKNAPVDPIDLNEFNNYKTTIFNADVLRILPLCKEDNLSEIDEKTDEFYYQSLKKVTDSGSKMYEVYMQYPESGTQAESYFSFIFGKVNGKFKMLSTYAKWPVK